MQGHGGEGGEVGLRDAVGGAEDCVGEGEEGEGAVAEEGPGCASVVAGGGGGVTVVWVGERDAPAEQEGGWDDSEGHDAGPDEDGWAIA